MADELKDQRIPIMMSPSEVKAIDDWMFANRMKSRAQAIRILCQIGLAIDEHAPSFFKFSENVTNEYGVTLDAMNTAKAKNVDKFDPLPYVTELLIRFTERMEDLRTPLRDILDVIGIYKGINDKNMDKVFTLDFVRETAEKLRDLHTERKSRPLDQATRK